MAFSQSVARIFEILSKYWTVSGSISFACGTVGNLINLVTLYNYKYFRKNRSTFYLIVESISDFLYQLFSITLTILISLYGNDLSSKSIIWCKLKFFLAQFFGLCTLSMISLQAIDQYFSTNPRFRSTAFFSIKFTRYFALIIIIVWFLHSVLCTFFVTIVPSTGCIISNPIWIRYVTIFFYPVLLGILPLAITAFFSLLAFRNVRLIIRQQIRIERRRFEKQITLMILTRTIFFVLFTCPYFIHRIYVVNTVVTENDPLQYAIGHLVQAIIVSIVNLNYTANFYIFTFVSSRYRRQVKHVLRKKIFELKRKCHMMKINQVHPENVSIDN